ncbi:hypothetical protein SprV_0100511400 [Sparganum proliferum]
MAVTYPTTALIVTPKPAPMDSTPMTTLAIENHTLDAPLPSITATTSFPSATNSATTATTTIASTPGTSEDSLDAPPTSTRTTNATSTGDMN